MASVNLQDRLLAPWSKIVTGETGESASVASPVTTPAEAVSVLEQIVMPETERSKDDCGSECDDNEVKKAVWGKALNGVVFEETVSDSPIGPDYTWPALGEATKSAAKSSIKSDSVPPPSPVSDGPLLPALQESVNNANPTSTSDQASYGQRSTKRGGGSTGAYITSNGGDSHQSPATEDIKVETPYNTSGKPGTAAMDLHSKDHLYKDLPRGGFGPQPNNGNNPYHQKNSYRRGNGSYHNNYGGKPNQGHGRGNQQWNQHRNFSNRDNNMQPHRGLRKGYVRPSVHNSTPFIHPPFPMPMRPFGNNVIYHGPVPPMVPPIPVLASTYFPFPNPLHVNIVKQIDYYFSNENLVRDTYLRRNMDEKGWVPVSLIAGFKKVSCLTADVQLILDVMRTSSLVEVQGDKIRRRNEWMRWLMPPLDQYSSTSSPKNVKRSLTQDSLVSQLHGISLSGPTTENQVHTGSSQRATVAWPLR